MPTATELVSQKSIDLIIESEGLDQPYLHPGGASGITIGIGDDLGYQTTEQFVSKWKGKLTDDEINRLKVAVGVKGASAAAMAHRFRGIKIKRADAIDVFMNYTIFEYYKLTLRTFTSLYKLCRHAKGAIVSLVYNRGSSLVGPSRREMANIKAILDKAPDPANNETYSAIGHEIRSMKRLWAGKGLDGLLTRRDAEAKLVESCIENA